ncbi:hypothetical protein UFOVP1083_52 [uncultured Caudovirales phage]|uniref:Uncharacterized protein n=1 Tax=uncultured Caudovirales phage TaxID=2100421 RepID=A0A6J5QLJ9_9CAUD|nr:hypothetical protein UFOVP1083_52 [uncultured Caudovirales phage]CAB4198913.1 hypothetical protein UFOVP1327_1 [uncultured Caudovirales phage]
MGNLFNPNDPNTWPENYKARTTAAFTNKGVPARDLAEDTVKNRFSGLTPKKRDPYYESGKTLFNMAVTEPVKSIGRTVSGKNAAVYANPFNGVGFMERGMKFGEDLLNVAALYPGVRAGSTAVRNSSVLASLKAGARPTASLDNYIFHGGVPPEKLVGGVIDPDFVRGGAKFNRGDPGNVASVKTGPNQVERDYILNKAEMSKATLAGEGSQESKAAAQEYLNRHSDIIKKIQAGEEHSTGVNRLMPEATYREYGGIHVLDVPKNLRTVDSPAPGGEVKFWGKQKPVGYAETPLQVGEGFGKFDPQYKKALQIMIDDADMKSAGSQKLANMLAKAKGTKITPAYKKLVEEVVAKEMGGEYRPFTPNPNFGKSDREILEYFQDYASPAVKDFKNIDQVVSGIRGAKTEKEIFSILQSAIPSDQLEIALGSRLNSVKSVEDMKKKVTSFITGLDPSYKRLKK